MASSENELVTLDDIYDDIEMQRSGISLLEKGICSIFCYEFKLCELTTTPEKCALQIYSALKLNSKSSESTLINIFKHFTSLIGTASGSTACLEEQQERELQKQVIPERENQLVQTTPCELPERLSDDVLDFVRTGRFSDKLLQLPLAFRGTTLLSFVEPILWGDLIRVSEDFTQVIKTIFPLDCRLDEYLRSPNWIVSYCPDGKTDSIRLLIISPFEANELIPMFRSGALVTQLRMFAARLHKKQDLLFYTPELSIPPTSHRQLPYCEMHDAELLVFSGTLFVADRRELLAYCRFLGLPPPLQTPEQQNYAFDTREPNDSIPLPVSANEVDSSSELPLSRFQNPRELAKRIVEIRFGRIPRGAHIESILLKSLPISK